MVKLVFFDYIESYLWCGYMGLYLLDEVVKIVCESWSTFIFINVCFVCEIWYLCLLEKYFEFVGIMVMYYSFIDKEVWIWVENVICEEKLKVVVCIFSFDFGVDFVFVEIII